ncbi:hypothetical protein [Oceanirhabdus sp. W0125-5]|uniref:hypothetical protein n=1 Tax=Oceanirhabdus sp. W0125-5 TaxID=2999116 RepID=UPI0022F2E52D|nr:hypothetical protein [Oceanirhabdus sp. W0125-5]WBW95257.1 hypothetical protein OW730_16365 [Oceanirhabdus sp. W0125-5]
MLISPSGGIIEEVISHKASYLKKEIEINKVCNWYIEQCGNDIVKLIKGMEDKKGFELKRKF